MTKPTSYDIGTRGVQLARIEIDFLKEFARVLPPSPIVVIIGAGGGSSSLAVLEERPDAFIWSIDITFPDAGIYYPGERYNLEKAGYWQTGSVVQVMGESQIVGRKWPVMYDMAFIDGDHRYEPVKVDIELWAPLCKQFGYLFFHDYADKTAKPKAGVKQAVDEYFDNNPAWHKIDRVANWVVGFRRIG